jgi:hypothetical protein
MMGKGVDLYNRPGPKPDEVSATKVEVKSLYSDRIASESTLEDQLLRVGIETTSPHGAFVTERSVQFLRGYQEFCNRPVQWRVW